MIQPKEICFIFNSLLNFRRGICAPNRTSELRFGSQKKKLVPQQNYPRDNERKKANGKKTHILDWQFCEQNDMALNMFFECEIIAAEHSSRLNCEWKMKNRKTFRSLFMQSLINVSDYETHRKTIIVRNKLNTIAARSYYCSL